MDSETGQCAAILAPKTLISNGARHCVLKSKPPYETRFLKKLQTRPPCQLRRVTRQMFINICWLFASSFFHFNEAEMVKDPSRESRLPFNSWPIFSKQPKHSAEPCCRKHFTALRVKEAARAKTHGRKSCQPRLFSHTQQPVLSPHKFPSV